MECLVTMTMQVPDGTTAEAVDDMRRREAIRARELAAAGTLLRLWRPPLLPGEWRTLGLFAAPDSSALEEALSSMPLRIWRTDEVAELGAHANDPGPHPASHSRDAKSREFLTRFDVDGPHGERDDAFSDARVREAQRARGLAEEGHLVHLWTLAPTDGRSRVLGLWRARDADELEGILASLPMIPWMKLETTPLSEYPSDPGDQPVGPKRSTRTVDGLTPASTARSDAASAKPADPQM
jgi:muconolactone delta-isomerase